MHNIGLEGNNRDLLKYEEIFHNLVGGHIANGDNKITSELTTFINHVSMTSRPAAFPAAIHQAYVLYVVCICLMEYRRRFDDDDKFYTEVYIPYIYHLLSSKFTAFKKMIIRIETKAYNHIEERASSIIDFSLVLHNISPDIIKSDTQQIFFKTTFIEIPPTELERTADYFFSSFQYIYYNYIKSKTSGIIPTDNLLEVKRAICAKNESRYSIYEYGLRSYQIQRICLKSDTLQSISDNFESIQESVISNQLLRILKSAYFPEIHDERMLLLKANSSSLNIPMLETEVPLICRLLRAIHIKSEKTIKLDNITYNYIRDRIYSTINNWISDKISDGHANEISAALSVSLSKSLLTGTYIDPQTLTVIEFRGNIFAKQFQKFIILMLDRIMGDKI